MKKIGFLINPIAGMGGKVGLKGTDNVVDIALKLGAEKTAFLRAETFLKNLDFKNLKIFTVSTVMGEDSVAKFTDEYKIVYTVPEFTTKEDTIRAVLKFVEERMDLIVFVGGDGTARDVISVTGLNHPVLGVPAGVKMYSGLFSNTPEEAGEIVKKFCNESLPLKEVDVLDIDESAYRADELNVKIYNTAKVPYVHEYIQNSKAEIYGEDEELSKQGIAEFVVDNMDESLYLLSPGTTVKKISEILGIEKTVLGIDAIFQKKLVAKDLNESKILELLKKYERIKLIISPIGNQGFVIGRGNLQLSSAILKRLKKEDIIIIATPAKISNLKGLRIDENREIIDKFEGFYKVLIGYGRYKVLKMI